MKRHNSPLLIMAFLFGVVASLPAHAAMTLEPGTSVTFHHHDLLGSPVIVSDHQGRVLWFENTTPYGQSLGKVSATGTGHLDNTVGEATSRPGYTGHTVDSTTGLVYMKARHYDPVIGRFYSNDPVGFQASNPMLFNRYAYANNNPYAYTDPDGREARLQTHHVAFGFNHSKIALVPDNQARYAQDSRFSNTLPDGRRYATIGAGPEDGKLVNGVNRERDVRQDVNKFDDLLNDGSGRTDDELIEDLLEAEGNFNSDRNYDTFPGVQPSYNSNSFVSGLLNFLGLSSSTEPNRVPGFDKLIPSEDFEPEQGP